MRKNFLTLVVCLGFAVPSFATTNYVAKWTKIGEFADCYLYKDNVMVNSGHPVDYALCEASAPTKFSWECNRPAFIHCYQFTPAGDVLNQGLSTSASYCSAKPRPSDDTCPCVKGFEAICKKPFFDEGD